MNSPNPRVEDVANWSQIGAFIATIAGLIIQLLILANPEWIMGMIGYPTIVRNILLILAFLVYIAFTVYAVISWGRGTANQARVPGAVVLYCTWTAALFLLVGIWLSTKPPLSCAGYGLKIVSPKPGEAVGTEAFMVEGTYATRPPDGRLVLYVISTDRTSYSPQYEVQFDPLNKRWVGKSRLADYATADVAVALLGNSGRVLFDYYWAVGRERNTWRDLDRLTDDTAICDQVSVRNLSTTPTRTP